MTSTPSIARLELLRIKQIAFDDVDLQPRERPRRAIGKHTNPSIERKQMTNKVVSNKPGTTSYKRQMLGVIHFKTVDHAIAKTR